MGSTIPFTEALTQQHKGAGQITMIYAAEHVKRDEVKHTQSEQSHQLASSAFLGWATFEPEGG